MLVSQLISGHTIGQEANRWHSTVAACSTMQHEFIFERFALDKIALKIAIIGLISLFLCASAIRSGSELHPANIVVIR